jgi:hypothetical protein
MRIFYVLTAAALTLGAMPARAQSSHLGRSVIVVIDTAVASSKQRRIKAELSRPLTFDAEAGPLDPVNRSDPRNFDIAGVRLGMSARDAEAAMRAAGYMAAFGAEDQPSYAGEVMQRWRSDFGFTDAWNDRVPHGLLWRKGEEEIRVELLALPEGARVRSVQYQAKEGAPISQDQFMSRVLAKYGEPANDNASDLRWCIVKAPECEDPREASYPLLSVWPESRQISLTGNDPAQAAALAERFAADVERGRPAERAASF